ncbi:hypothetical protein RC74_09880 [Falsihalocynthiibacter arcticus]|uniref:Uncharacterized protein n=1 Tax=Falsihalocynthiibacter arcticus TaxID=1579316 RepID=A0A126V0Z8_9RHOB|nr:hypothetical protein [Falsihalocynthiibacter arcticus]AML51526.1 hypothetical protein RC74_09880 [Falsihalocynthiibacter arcticus]
MVTQLAALKLVEVAGYGLIKGAFLRRALQLGLANGVYPLGEVVTQLTPYVTGLAQQHKLTVA